MIAQPHHDLIPDLAKLGKLPEALPALTPEYSAAKPNHHIQPDHHTPMEAAKRFQIDVENSREYFDLFQRLLTLFKRAGRHPETAKRVDERMEDFSTLLVEGERWIQLLGVRVDILTTYYHGLTHWIEQSDHPDQIELALKQTSQIAPLIKQYGQIVQELKEDWDERLLAKILTQVAQFRNLSAKEKIFLLDAAKIDIPIKKMPSMRREEWYGDDGR